MEYPKTTKNIGQPCVICGQPTNLQRALDAEREKVRELEQEGLQLFEWRLALHSLTPGGSEFCTPDACESWVRKIRASQHEHIIEQIKQRKELQAQLATLQAQHKEKDRRIWELESWLQVKSPQEITLMESQIIKLQAQLRQVEGERDQWIAANTKEPINEPVTYQALAGARFVAKRAFDELVKARSELSTLRQLVEMVKPYAASWLQETYGDDYEQRPEWQQVITTLAAQDAGKEPSHD